MLHNFVSGLSALGNWQAIAYLVGGSLIGVFFGVIPGLGGAVVLSIILAFIYHISLTGAVCLFLAVQAGSYFSASMTSILLNTPAHPEAFAVTFDGFPMAQRGEAGRALGISASATCLGGFVGCAVLVGFIQIINYLPSIFHPPEYVGLIAIALILVGTLGADSASKALISGAIGLMLATIGSDPVTGTIRFTFGSVALYSGISLVALALGLFAIPQMILVFGTATTVAREDMLGKEVDASQPVDLEKGVGRQVIGGIAETLSHWVALIRAGLIGVVTGIVPGIGGFAANFLSYGIAQQVSRSPERFGTGIPEGIIAPEGSSLAKEAGGMVPIIGLGIPGGVGGALFLAALLIKGVKTGYGFTAAYPSLPYEMVWVIALGGLIGTTAGLLAAPMLARVTKVPGPLLVPIIMALSVVGTFVSDVSFFSVMEVLVFTAMGLVLRRLRYSLASFAIGLVLGPQLEVSIFQTRDIFPHWRFLQRPLADALFLIAIGVLILKTVQLRRAARVSKAGRLAKSIAPKAQGQGSEPPSHAYPLLSIATSLVIIGISTAFAIYASAHFDFDSAILPVAYSAIAGGVALWRLPFEAVHFARYVEELKSARRSRELGDVERAVAEQRVMAYATDGAARGASGPGVSSLSSADITTSAQPLTAPQTFGSLPRVEEKSWGLHGQYTRELVAMAWFGALVVACYVVGFKIGVPAFVGLYGLTATRRVWSGWTRRALFAVIAATIMWAATYEMQSILHIVFTPVIRL